MRGPLVAAVHAILKSLIRLLFNNGFAFGDFSNIAKHAYVEVVEQELRNSGDKPTTSRISIATGLSRKEVAALRKQTAPLFEQDYHKNRAVRVISAWISDPLYFEQVGVAKKLQIQGEEDSFEQLVSSYSGDIPYRAMLDELIRLGAAKEGENEVELLQAAWVPSEDEQEIYILLGEDVAALIDTFNHNIRHGEDDPRYQRKVCYDRVPAEFIPRFRRFANAENQKLLVKLNKWLAGRDMDYQSAIRSDHAVKVGVGVYYFEEDTATP